jgi:hypothetical protein
MAKAPWIDDETAQKLRMVYTEICQRDKKPPEVKTFIYELITLNKEDSLQRDFKKGFKVPSGSWFNKKERIPTWKREWEKFQIKPSKEDFPWHLATLKDVPITADFIPVIFDIQKLFDKNITIRVVKWLTYLHGVIRRNEILYFVALTYAQSEQISEIAGVPFNSFEFDAGLLDFLQLVSGKSSSFKLTLDSAPVSISVIHTITSWIMTNLNLLDNEEYFNKILNALKQGYFSDLSIDEAKSRLITLRQNLPELCYHATYMDFESFAKVWSMTVKKD